MNAEGRAQEEKSVLGAIYYPFQGCGPSDGDAPSRAPMTTSQPGTYKQGFTPHHFTHQLSLSLQLHFAHLCAHLHRHPSKTTVIATTMQAARLFQIVFPDVRCCATALST